MNKNDKQLGIMGLTSLVVGTMIAGGIFALPQNLAESASAGAIAIGWIITAIGIFSLAMVFRYLTLYKPELNNGIYMYAKTGFGHYMGFNSAWGYWLSAIIGNVSYAVLLFSAAGYFFATFGNGNTPAAILAASLLLWGLHFLILHGIKQAVSFNIIATIAKLVPITLFIILVIAFFNIERFNINFWDMNVDGLGTVFGQVKSTMLVTLWVFVGIEGAIVESSRAKNSSDVTKATFIGLFLAMIIYVLISILSFGIVTQPELAQAKNPSMAYILQQIIGPAGLIIVNVGLIISLLGAWLGWTLLCIQLPFDSARDATMPRALGKTNARRSPAVSLWITNVIIQIFLIITLVSHESYLTIIKLGTSCILIPYLFSTLYALKIAMSNKERLTNQFPVRFYIITLLATLYVIWLIYAAGIEYLLASMIVYAAGLFFYYWARRENKARVFTKIEFCAAVIIVILAIISAIDLLAQLKT